MTLPARLFCDTSFFYAALDPTDAHHERARTLFGEIASAQTGLLATWDVVSETVTLLRYRRGFQAALAFLTEIKPRLRIVSYGDAVRAEAERVFVQRGRGRVLSYCDAISFVVVTTMLGHMPCVAFDDDFRALGLTVIR